MAALINPPVVHISTVHPSDDQRVFHRECRSLADGGFATHLIIHAEHRRSNIRGVHIHSLGPPRAPALGTALSARVWAIAKAARIACKHSGALYHLHDPELLPLGFFIKLVSNAKVIFDSHENNVAFVLQKDYLHPFVRFTFAKVLAGMERVAARFFDAIVTADRGTADIFERYGARAVTVLHNYPRLELFPPSTANRLQRRPFDLVYHGTIPRYHLEMAFDVDAELVRRGFHVRWLFIGRCLVLDWARRELKRRGLENHFVFEKRVPHDAVAEKVASARIGYIPLPNLPKFQHNIPTKLFEFMALGMPTVLTDLPPSRPFVKDSQCAILLPPADTSAQAEAIITLLGDTDRMERMGRDARRKVEQQYNWAMESRKLLALYRNLLSPDDRE